MMMRCRLCNSVDIRRLPFDLPPEYPSWFRCCSCGSDSSELTSASTTGFLPRPRATNHPKELAKLHCDWFTSHKQPIDQTFLDVGCGDGTLLDVMQAAGWAVHGFEFFSVPIVRHTITIAPVFHRWLLPRRFHAVFCSGVVEWIESPDLL